MEFNGLPLHPLVVHAVVVFAPLAALAAVLYAVLPRWRYLLRWPMVVATLIALVGAIVAVQAGEALLDSRAGLEQLPAVQDHEEHGERLRLIMVGFAAVVGFGAWRLGGPSGLVSGRGERKVSGGPLDILAMGLLVLAAIAVVVGVFLAGDSGSRAVWEL